MQTVSGFHKGDHDRLDDLFKNFQKLKQTDFPKAREFFVSFKFGLQRHLAWEEEILFPAFEAKTGSSSGGPTEVMRLEHEEIVAHLSAIDRKVKLFDLNSELEEQNLIAVLSFHNRKEEQILYSFIDRSFSPEEVSALFDQMWQIPREKDLPNYQYA